MWIYPAIDIREGRAVRLIQGDYARETVFSPDPVSVALGWQDQGADRIHLVDLDGAKAGRPINLDVVRRIVRAVKIPCQLGGGIRTSEELQAVFEAGIQWAVLGTKALQDPQWLEFVATHHPERIVLGLDARNGLVATDGWLNTSQTSAADLLRRIEGIPLSAVVYTDIATDGMMGGPNYVALEEVRHLTTIPVIASGGISTMDHARRLADTGTFGCIIGRALYEGTIRLNELLALVRANPGSQAMTPPTLTT